MGKFIDLSGQKFNKLTVISRAANSKHNQVMWNCFCECGNTCVVSGGNFKAGKHKSCGCSRYEFIKTIDRSTDLTGKKFGKLTAVIINGKHKDGSCIWLCRCDCGKETNAISHTLKSGRKKSCGCLKSSHILKRIEKHIDKGLEKWIWKGCKDKHGYGVISYNKKSVKVHRIIYELFIGDIPKGMFVCHKNDIPFDVTPSNLFLGTHKDNMNDRDSKGRQPSGEKNGLSKLKESQVLDIRNSYLKTSELSKIYGVNRHTISLIKKRKTWKHI